MFKDNRLSCICFYLSALAHVHIFTFTSLSLAVFFMCNFFSFLSTFFPICPHALYICLHLNHIIHPFQLNKSSATFLFSSTLFLCFLAQSVLSFSPPQSPIRAIAYIFSSLRSLRACLLTVHHSIVLFLSLIHFLFYRLQLVPWLSLYSTRYHIPFLILYHIFPIHQCIPTYLSRPLPESFYHSFPSLSVPSISNYST